MNTALKLGLWLAIVSTSCLASHVLAQQFDGSPPGGPSDERMTKMLAEQQKKRDDALRKTLKKLGYKDKELQDKIIAYAQERDRKRIPLEQATTQLALAVKEKNSNNEQVRTALDAMRRAVVDERMRRAKERTEREESERLFDVAVGYSKDPKLEANLMMLGLVGEETEMLAIAAPGYESEVSAPGGDRPWGGRGGGMGGPGGGGGFPGGGRMPRW